GSMSTSAVCARRGALRSSDCSAPSTGYGFSGELILLSVLGRVAWVLGALLAAAAAGTSCTAGHADPELPAVFTADQARQGRRVYKTACASCHGSDLEGAAAPPLAGPAFLQTWQPPARSAQDLYHVMRVTMPKLAIGSLKPDDYTAVFAFLLQRNGWPAGRRRFDASDTMLSQIRLDAVVAPAALAPTEFIAGKDGPPLDPTGPSLSELAGATSANWRPRWRYTWQPREYELWPMNRGAALARGHVIRGTADGYLLALDARDGQLLWARQVARPQAGETITMAPLIYGDLVVIGPAGSENNIKGWIGAFRLAEGTPVWRFNTVPRPG